MYDQDFKYDVLLSHASEDEEWCRRLAERLRREGVRVWFDLWRLRIGDHLLMKLNEGLAQSRQTIAVWTNSYFRDDKQWTKLENFSLQFSDPLAKQRSIIPVLREDTKVPPTLNNLIYIDFRDGVDFEVQFRKLIESLNLPPNELRYRYRARSSKAYLEERIREVLGLALETQRSLSSSETAGDSSSPSKDDYGKIAEYYLATYLHLCKRLNLSPEKDIVEAMSLLRTSAGFEQPERSIQPVEVYTSLEGSRIIRLGISQMFRMVDLLTRPESVKAKRFYEAVTKIEKMRRMLNPGAKGIPLGALGNLRPVVSSMDAYDQFWKSGLPDPRLPGSSPLCFVPYELSLSEQLQDLRSELDSVLDSALLTDSTSIQNVQVSGRLRIYPAGIGVVNLSITLDFRTAVHIEIAAQIAHNVEALLFVDPVGLRKPYHRLMLEIIDQVIEHVFKKEGLPFAERRWLPPLTSYSLRNDRGLTLERNTTRLAYLMSLAPGNREDLQYLVERIQRALRSRNWTREGIMAVAGQSVALFFIRDVFAKGNKRKRDELQNWLIETHELVSAASYAQQAFAEQIQKLCAERLLNDSWLTQDAQNYLCSLLETMRQVMQAIASVRSHLKDQGAGVLMPFSSDLWTYNHPVDKQPLQESLEYIAAWLTESKDKLPYEMFSKLERIVRDIELISPPFATSRVALVSKPSSPLQEELEFQLLSELQVIESLLKRNTTQSSPELAARFQIVEELRQQLGIEPTASYQ
jgi:TIR domain